MVLVPKAVIHKSTMMVKALYALVAVVTVHTVLWTQVLTVYADIVQV